MTDRPKDAEHFSAEEAPELHNAEQDDEQAQAQTVATDAGGQDDAPSPLDSVKPKGDGTVMDDSTQDLIDKMRDMEASGRIDMGAFRGEPDMDDEDETYGTNNDPDEA